MTLLHVESSVSTLLNPREFRLAAQAALMEVDQPEVEILTTLVGDGYVSLELRSVGRHLWVPREARETFDGARAWLVQSLRREIPGWMHQAKVAPHEKALVVS